MRIINVLIVVLGLGIVTHNTTEAGYDYRSAAISDGIGYRSNLIDPGNPYHASIRHMFGTLLLRFSLLPEDTDLRDQAGPNSIRLKDESKQLEYKQSIQAILDNPESAEHWASLPRYPYAFGLCATNNTNSALPFMQNVALSDLMPEVRDSLIHIRHDLILLCHIPPQERQEMRQILNDRIHRLSTISPAAKPWTDYLRGAIAFYAEDLDMAQNAFTEVPKTATQWLYRSARYMEVRIAKSRLAELTHEESLAIELLDKFDTELERFIGEFPTGPYSETARDLRRYLLNQKGDKSGLIRILAETFTEKFQSGALADEPTRIAIFHELTRYHAAEPDESLIPLYDKGLSPFLAVLDLLSSHRMKVLSHDSQPNSQPASLGFTLQDASESFAPYPGLLDYALLLTLDDNSVAEAEIKPETYGALFADALVLQGRALSKLGMYMRAAETWSVIEQSTTTYNAPTEIATAYMRLGRFEAFLPFVLSDGTDKNPSTGSHVYDEFDITAETFRNQYQPHVSLLERGLDSFADPDKARIIALNPDYPPDIRFMAMEPLLRRAILTGNHKDYLELAETSGQMLADATISLAHGYRDLTSTIRTLSQRPDDPKALTDLGYFLYANRLYFGCLTETLWESHLGGCPVETKDMIVPIELFSKALAILTKRSMRSKEEGRLLRIMIFCYKSFENIHHCTRNKTEDYPMDTRLKWFLRLHRYFPEDAARTPYWY